MKGLPAFCRNCGIVFEVQNSVQVTGNSTIRTIGNKVRCPQCLGWAEMADGTFQFDDNAVRLIQGSKWTQAQVEAIQRVYRDLKDKKEVTPGAIDALEKVSPELGEAAKAITGRYGKSVMAVAMLGLLLSKCSVNVDIDVNDLVHGHSVEASQNADKSNR